MKKMCRSKVSFAPACRGYKGLPYRHSLPYSLENKKITPCEWRRLVMGESAKLAKNVNSTVVGPRDKKGQCMADTVSSPAPYVRNAYDRPAGSISYHIKFVNVKR